MLISQKYKTFLVRCAALLALAIGSGCQITKLDTRQGNYVSQEMIDKLKVGMDKVEVQSIMGTPAITPVINLDRWDYIYHLQPGKPKEQTVQQRLTLYFKHDKLQTYSGDWIPKYLPKKK